MHYSFWFSLLGRLVYYSTNVAIDLFWCYMMWLGCANCASELESALPHKKPQL